MVHFHHVQRPRLAPLVRLKMRNFKLGTIVERTFSPDDKFEDARIDERKLQYMYRQGDSFHFMDTDNYEQYEFNEKQVGEQAQYLRKKCSFPCLYMRERSLESTSPTKSTFASIIRPPASKGDTVGNATKLAKLETGAEVMVPMFIKEGDTVRVDTRTGEYVERV